MKKIVLIILLATIANFAFSQSRPDTTYEYYFLSNSPSDSIFFYENIYHYDTGGRPLYIENIYKRTNFFSQYLTVSSGNYVTYYEYDESFQEKLIFMLNENNDTIFKQSFFSKGNDLEYLYQIRKNGKLVNCARYYYYNIRNRVSTPLLNEVFRHLNIKVDEFSYYHSDSIYIEFFDTLSSQHILASKIYFAYSQDNKVERCIQKNIDRFFTLDLFYDNSQRCNRIECTLTLESDSCSDRFWYFTQTFNEYGQPLEMAKMPYNSLCYNNSDFYGVKDNFFYGENNKLLSSKVYWNDADSNWSIYSSKYYRYNTTKINYIKKETISIFPNPVNSVLMVKNEGVPIKEVCIYNISGQKVKQFHLNSCENTLDVSCLPAGMYIAKIKTEEGLLTRKMQILK